jgi:hypothetical protein
VSDLLDKTVGQLPSIWFDWYARLLPGCFGLGLYMYLSSSIPQPVTAVDGALFLAAAYILGHILQPLAGFMVKGVEELYGREPAYAKAKRNSSTRVSSLNTVSKAHAEANSMAAFALALLLNLCLFWNSKVLNKYLAFATLTYFALAFLERTRARDRKIKDLLE